MSDLWLRETDRDDLVAEIVTSVVNGLRPLFDERQEYLDAEQLAKAIGVSRSTVDRLVRDGKIPSILVGRIRRFDLKSVIEDLQKKGDAE